MVDPGAEKCYTFREGYERKVVAEADDILTFELRVWDNYDRYYARVLSQYQVQQDGKVSYESYEVYEVTE